MKKICASEIQRAVLRVLFQYCNSAGAQNMQSMHLGRAGQSGTSFPNTNQPARAMTPPSKTTADHLLVSCNTPCTAKTINSRLSKAKYHRRKFRIFGKFLGNWSFPTVLPEARVRSGVGAQERRLLDNGFTVGREAQQTAAERFVEPALTKV